MWLQSKPMIPIKFQHSVSFVIIWPYVVSIPTASLNNTSLRKYLMLSPIRTAGAGPYALTAWVHAFSLVTVI
jgi:hypothetical protein